MGVAALYRKVVFIDVLPCLCVRGAVRAYDRIMRVVLHDERRHAGIYLGSRDRRVYIGGHKTPCAEDVLV